jgi:SulP family sulfate permease
VIGVEFAILIGVAVSILLFVPRAAKLRVAELVVSDERIVRERLPSDAPCTAVTICDLEGELFFGAAPALEAEFEAVARRARERGIRHVVLRLKRLRNPDAVCLEKIDHFLRATQKEGLVVLLAGVRDDLLAGIRRLRFTNWFPKDHIFVEVDTEDSATLQAVRLAYSLLGNENTCNHCATRPFESGQAKAAYYLV